MPRSNTQQSTAKKKAEDAYEKAEEATAETVENIKDQVQEKLEASSESVKNATQQAENLIKERPLLSVGCAFLAGWAVSKLIK
ncbi:hypothetical protein [Vibrio sp. MA40-2]|uniref:hypothetical protein n=1 Tax=Vibrio sp. MA40-2 TaxID=3391828 RepID=UPI0039A5541F